MKYFLSSFLFLFCIKISLAQYTEVINSRRPGFSDSPYSIGTKVYQIEGGLFYKNTGNYAYWDKTVDPPLLNNYSSKAFGSDITFRTGQFFEQLEFNLDLIFLNEERKYKSPDVYDETGLGLSKLTIGAKYLLYKPEYTDKSKEIRSWKARHSFDKRRLIPAVGIYAGFNTNLLHEMHKNPGGVSPRFAIFTQNDLSNRLIVLTNFIADQLFTDESENSFIITTTYTLTEKTSIFGEVQGFFRKSVPNDFQFGGGAAYLLNRNMQVDLSARMIYDERNDSSYIISGGLSWRLDNHKDKIKQVETDNNENSAKEKKGFVNTITFGLFAKNNAGHAKKKNVKSIDAKTRSLTPPVNKKAQKAKKKQNKRLIKQQKEKEKAQKKYNKKSEKN